MKKHQDNESKKEAVIALSGGMDSTSLLLHLLNKGYAVTAISIAYGQKHHVELARAQSLADYLTTYDLPLHWHQITLSGLGPLLSSALITGGSEIPEGHYEKDNMKATFVPNRNKIISSIIQSVALSRAQILNDSVCIGMGIHAGDHTIYPDCRPSFREKDHEAFVEGNWDAEKIDYYTPYLKLNKSQVLKDGVDACYGLGLPYQSVYARTMTSYKPLKINGHWYSDYQSASSVERIEAFMANDMIDPVHYVDQNGKQKSWHEVCEHVKMILKKDH